MPASDAALTVAQTMLARHRPTDPNYRADVALLAEALDLGLGESEVKAALGSSAASPDMDALRSLVREHLKRHGERPQTATRRRQRKVGV